MRIIALFYAVSSLTQILTAAESFPQLEPHRAKYARDRQFLGEAEMREIEAVQPRYVEGQRLAAADEKKPPPSSAPDDTPERKNLLIIGASSLISPLGQP